MADAPGLGPAGLPATPLKPRDPFPKEVHLGKPRALKERACVHQLETGQIISEFIVLRTYVNRNSLEMIFAFHSQQQAKEKPYKAVPGTSSSEPPLNVHVVPNIHHQTPRPRLALFDRKSDKRDEFGD